MQTSHASGSRRGVVLWVAFFVGLSAGFADARPRFKHNLGRYYGELLPARLDACTTCHDSAATAEASASPAEKMPPHNAFGARLKAAGEELRARSLPAELPHRLRLIREEDADGDGVANEIEILAGTLPGLAGDEPTGADLAAAVSRRNAFADRSPVPWSPFQPVSRPGVPVPASLAWCRQPVDAFIASRREAANLAPRPEASPQVLLRRLHLDLVGLAPSPVEIAAFLDDDSPDAYERAADRLLARPQHGERWGRHWMDVWRYSDWAGWGDQVRDSQPNVWRWRDWIIESLNRDRGYDRMLVEMLAGDELAPEDPEILRATGYLVRSFKLLSREAWMQEAVDHTAQAFLGLTFGCARCHDHMYDPISQRDYYQLRAVFEPYQVRLDRLPGRGDPVKDGLARVFDASLDVKTFLFLRGDERFPDKDQPLAPGVPAVLGGAPLQSQPVALALTAHAPDKRAFAVAEARQAAGAAVVQARDAFRQAVLASAQPDKAADPGVAEAAGAAEMAVAIAEARRDALLATLEVEALEDQGGKEHERERWQAAAIEATRAQRWLRLLEARSADRAAGVELARLEREKKPEAEVNKAKEAAAKAARELVAAREAAVAPPADSYTRRDIKIYPASSTGRRLAFARWLTDPTNPLVARVAANHIWLRHFGQALVPSVSDFGLNGRPPSHPELLDWLAAELMAPDEAGGEGEGSWTMKRVHRLLVTSASYRMSATPDAAALAHDPDNVLLWRMSSRRLEAESVRDNALWAAGLLELKLGGVEVDHKLLLSTHRRSLYYRHAAEKQAEFLKVFDMASVTECYERRTSVMPQQALALSNTELVLTCARAVARELIGAAPEAAAFARASFLRILSRQATAPEVNAAVEFLAAETRRFEELAPKQSAATSAPADLKEPSREPALRARENLVHALLNHNDFVTVR